MYFLTAYETENAFLKNELKEMFSELQVHKKMCKAKSKEVELMKVSLKEKAASLSGMHVKYMYISYHRVYHLWYM